MNGADSLLAIPINNGIGSTAEEFNTQPAVVMQGRIPRLIDAHVPSLTG